MYELKYKSQQFGKMNEESLLGHARGLVIKISLITGWPIPEDQSMRNILYDQFSKKIIEDYSTLNVEEIEYAIRSYGTKIKDWGKNINLSLIDEALTPYVIERTEMSKIEERSAPVAQIEYDLPPMDEDEMVEAAKKTYLLTKKVGLIMTKVYEVLEKRGELVIDNEEKKKIKEAVERRLRNEAEQDGLKAVKDLVHLKNNQPNDYDLLVRNECKRYAVAEYFTRMNEIDNF